jgi:NADH-quinone oxidoreductase subunit L
MHGMNDQTDIRRFGGLWKYMKITWATTGLGYLAIIGIPPLSGFFSKEAILAGVWEAGLLGPFLMLALTVGLTAFYMGRAVVLTFGSARHTEGHPHDPPAVMMAPLWLLAVLAAGAGVLATDRLSLSLPQYVAEHIDAALPHGPGWLTPLSIALAVVGLAGALLVYQWSVVSAARLRAAFGPLAWAAEQGYGLDALYVAAYRGVILAISRVVGWIDRYLVDGLVNVASAWTLQAGAALRSIQTGRAQDYLYGIAAGFLLLALLWRAW